MLKHDQAAPGRGPRKGIVNGLRAGWQLWSLSCRWQLGRGYGWVPVGLLVWPLGQALWVVLGWRSESFGAADAQNVLIGAPLYVLAVGLGARLVASEVEQRTLEVAYTLPGGARRVWLTKAAAACGVLLCGLVVLGLCTAVVLTDYPVAVLYRVWQGAVFFLVLAMGAGALLNSELMAALEVSLVLLGSLWVTDRVWSPLFNPLVVSGVEVGALWRLSVVQAFGMAGAIVGLLAVALVRTERREALLKG